MTNEINKTEDIEWNEGVRKHLHKLTVTINILILSVLGILAIIGCHLYFYIEVGLEGTLENLMFFVSVIILPVMLMVFAYIRDNLNSCYRDYLCKECGHIHRPKLEELSDNTDRLHCPNCDKTTRHKRMPFDKKSSQTI